MPNLDSWNLNGLLRHIYDAPTTADAKRQKEKGAAHHKVSFSGSSKSSGEHNGVQLRSPSTASRSSSPQPQRPILTHRPSTQRRWSENRNWQRINRQSEALWQETIPADTVQPRPFLIFHDSFHDLLGPNPTLQVLISDPRAPYFHEAGVFHPPTNTLFITSNQIPDASPDAVATQNKTIVITKVEFFSPTDFTRDKVRCPERNYMANGGTNYRDGLIICAQGSLREPAALIYMEAKRPHKTTTLLNNYHNRPFNSPNDVVVHSDGSIWFTDPIYGYEQGFRPKPQLPQLVYRFDPATGDVRAMADGFGRPNGICFAPGEETVYITDTDQIHGNGLSDLRRAATIYAYSVYWENDSPFLINRRVFAYADSGVPDGIKCDVLGNVYAGCGDGINVWSAGGMLIGKILIEGGCANFCFGREGEMWCFGEHRLWRVKLGDETRGALLGI
ncbi:hypothetical protein MMC12_004254 [Toensbergia leucococca]|nr:hypothetical protein [Toensbergia leucococca]